MLFRKHEHNIPEKSYPHTEGDFSLAGLSFREKIRKMRQDPRGIEIGQLIWIVVGVLAASALGVFIFNQVTDTGSTVEEAGSTEIATFQAACDGQTVGRVGILGNATSTLDEVEVNFTDDVSGYRQPAANAAGTADLSATDQDPAAGNGVVGLVTTETDGQPVGFLRTVDALTEAAYNADFNNDGTINAGEVLVLLSDADVALAPVADGAKNTEPSTNGPAILAADPGVNIAGVRVGSEIVVDRINACWGVKLA